MNPALRDSRPAFLLSLIFPLALLVAGFAAHEPWRDEIQAWLMARDMSLPELVANAGAEGHPIGWHLLCKILLAAGLPFESLGVVSLLFALAAGCLVVRRAPFPRFLKFFLLCSPIFFMLGIAARPYMLIVLLLFLQAGLFPERMRHPLAYALCLGALAQLMVLCLPYVGVMALWWSYESLKPGKADGRTRAGLGLVWLLTVLAVLQLIPPWDKLALMLDSRQSALAAWHTQGGFFLMGPPELTAVLGVFLAGCAWMFLLGRVQPFLALAGAGSCLFAVAIDYGLYPLSPCHWLSVLAMLAALTWIGTDLDGKAGQRHKKPLFFILFLACIASAGYAFPEWRREMTLPSSNLPKASAFMREHLSKEAVAVHTMAKVCPLLKDFPGKRFWNPVSRSWGSFAVFDAKWQKQRGLSVDEAASIILAFCPEERPVMVFSAPWEGAQVSGYALFVEFSEPTVYKEPFYIYHSQKPTVRHKKAQTALNENHAQEF